MAATPSPYTCSTTQTYANYHQPAQAPTGDSNELLCRLYPVYKAQNGPCREPIPTGSVTVEDGPSVCQSAQCFVRGGADAATATQMAELRVVVWSVGWTGARGVIVGVSGTARRVVIENWAQRGGSPIKSRRFVFLELRR
ncbi:hypothetical protein GB937_002239 [Aspergillus fischeri]|nr:hypothetical protein GB937_002239 [Aspergillus fischeri]